MFSKKYNVNNGETLKKLATTAFKANKLRNLFCVVAIILTTILFTAFFSIVSNVLSAIEDASMRMVGASSHGSFKYLTQEDYDKLKSHRSIAEISYSVFLGVAENDALKKRQTEIRYTSGENNARAVFSLPTSGVLPTQKNQMATDTLVLKALGIPAQLGQRVTIDYTLDGSRIKETFVLVGFWDGDPVTQASRIWLSPDYVKAKLDGRISTTKDDYIGKIFADVNFRSKYAIEEKMQGIIRDSGYAPGSIAYGVNWAYVGNDNAMDLGTKVSLAVIVALIGLSGYLMISNVFYISVAKDIQYFGLLKTVGTTGKQISAILRRQALYMCTLAIPAGLISGSLVGWVLTPMIFAQSTMDRVTNEVAPHVLVFSAVFSLLTVLISLARPAKMASQISPIQALKTFDTEENNSLGSKKQNGTPPKAATKRNTPITPLNLALRNFWRHKKKALQVVLSLSLSLVILNGTFSLANSFDMDSYLKDMLYGDFQVADAGYFSPLIGYEKQASLSENFLESLWTEFTTAEIANVYYTTISAEMDPRLKNMPQRLAALKDIEPQRILDIKDQVENGRAYLATYGLDDSLLQALDVLEGSLDMEKLKSGNYIILAPHDEGGLVKYYEVGDKVDFPRADGTKKTYEVLAIANIPHTLSVRRWHMLNLQFFLPSQVFLTDIEQKSPMVTTIKVADDQVPNLEIFLSQYEKNVDDNLQHKSKASLVAEFHNMQKTYKIVGSTLGLIVALIGIMNFSNTTITSIMARKRELAMLQSMGMTRRQMGQMLFYEGISYTALATLVSLTLGTVLISLSIGGLLEGSTFASPRITLLPSLFLIPILILISSLIPYFSRKLIIGTSLVESLRGID